MPFEDVGGNSVTYAKSDELEEREGIQLRVCAVGVIALVPPSPFRRLPAWSDLRSG